MAKLKEEAANAAAVVLLGRMECHRSHMLGLKNFGHLSLSLFFFLSPRKQSASSL